MTLDEMFEDAARRLKVKEQFLRYWSFPKWYCTEGGPFVEVGKASVTRSAFTLFQIYIFSPTMDGESEAAMYANGEFVRILDPLQWNPAECELNCSTDKIIFQKNTYK